MKDKYLNTDVTTSEFIPVAEHKGHHARMMKMEGNDYAHIWESPLPLPLTLHQLEHELKHHHAHGERRSQPDLEVCCKDATLDIIQGSDCETCETMPRMKRKGPNGKEYSYEAPRYFVLDRDAVNVFSESSPTHRPAPVGHATTHVPQRSETNPTHLSNPAHVTTYVPQRITCTDPRDPRAEHRTTTRKLIK